MEGMFGSFIPNVGSLIQTEQIIFELRDHKGTLSHRCADRIDDNGPSDHVVVYSALP